MASGADGASATSVTALAVDGPGGRFRRTTVPRRALREHDVRIAIRYAGICHSDLHHADGEGGRTIYPLVPGHEIAGIVTAVGPRVTRFGPGDRAGVGCLVDACRECPACRRGLESYCRKGKVLTYDALDHDGEPTYGGYSEAIVVDERFSVAIPDGLTLERAAPLMCAGITLYSPLRRWHAGPGTRVGIVGLGGLGHVGTQIAHKLGAHVTVLELGHERRADALRLGADDLRSVLEPATFHDLADSFDLIVSTVPSSSDLDPLVGLLDLDGVLVSLGAAGSSLGIAPRSLLTNRRIVTGSLSGGMAETEEMMAFCAAHGIGAEVEVVAAAEVDDAFRRLRVGDVRFRFVIDTTTLSG
jgi:alcohol dehydrogenase (NADP+)